MKTLISALAVATALGLAGTASAQASGGPDAKGNAPLKHPHTVNDGAAKHGANSFTEGQARIHIEKAGFTGVTNLVKGDDGVWRGQAMRGGKTLNVAMDFKGNVSTAGAGAAMAPASAARSTAPVRMSEPATPADASASTTTSAATTTTTTHHARAHHHRSARHHRD